ncbi:MAG: hypothetical protein AB2558_21430 [Candidatus Thiodiazotropha sp.]
MYHNRALPPYLYTVGIDEALTYQPQKKDKIIEYDSYIIKEYELKKGDYRLLDVNRRVVMPVGKTLARVRRDDVIHRWFVPSLGVKMDAVPGKQNIFQVTPKKVGVFYGMCAELCGVNHSYIPIAVETLPILIFRK